MNSLTVPPFGQKDGEMRKILPDARPVFQFDVTRQLLQRLDQADNALHWDIPVVELVGDSEHEVPELGEEAPGTLFLVVIAWAVVREEAIDLLGCMWSGPGRVPWEVGGEYVEQLEFNVPFSWVCFELKPKRVIDRHYL